jgi:hypothetical protein
VSRSVDALRKISRAIHGPDLSPANGHEQLLRTGPDQDAARSPRAKRRSSTLIVPGWPTDEIGQPESRTRRSLR